MSNLFDDFDLDIQNVSARERGVFPQSEGISTVSEMFSCGGSCATANSPTYNTGNTCSCTVQGCPPATGVVCNQTAWTICICDAR